MSKKKVMDDLDALLADLQSTTSHIANYQQQQQANEHPSPTVQKNTVVTTIRTRVDDHGDPPSQDTIDGQPLYEPQVIRTLKSSQLETVTTSVSRTQYRANPVTTPTQSQGLKALPAPPGGSKPMSLTNNLSELDSLLQDLSSAQFMAEVDRRNAANLSNEPPPGSPRQKDRTVDSLLNELENFVPPQRDANLYEEIHPKGASTATRELDDLMNSLSEFKVKDKQPPHEGDPPYAQVQKPKHHERAVPQQAVPVQAQANNNLEDMLGNLSTDMAGQGISTVPKGHCAACAKPIVGQVITALGAIWHPEHFVCVHCHEELGTLNFFERDGQQYCERDYHNLFSPRCAHCSGPILDKCVTALEKTWHPEHFFCAQCGLPFGEGGFHERDGKAYCRDDYFQIFAPKCGGCSQAIMDNYISALNRQWHTDCFACFECHTPFGGASFYDHDGMPYCETHYHAKRGSLCAGCHKPITGRCITAMYKKFHPEHFVCAFCLKQLNKGTFKEQNEKPYCHPCFTKLFG